MKFKSIIVSAVILCLMSGLFCYAIPNQLTIDINGGVSQPLWDKHQDWNTGFSVGVQSFIWVMENLGFGGRLAINRWTPDQTSLERKLQNLSNIKLTGSTTIIEFLPSMRARTLYEGSPINFFFQGGLGLYLLNSHAELQALQLSIPVKNVLDKDAWNGRFGFSFGPGISFGSINALMIDVFPLYHLVLNSDEAFQYLSANIGVGLGF